MIDWHFGEFNFVGAGQVCYGIIPLQENQDITINFRSTEESWNFSSEKNNRGGH